MAEIDFYPLDLSYKIEGEPVVELYGRAMQKDGNLARSIMKYKGFVPYFWVIPKDMEAEEASEKANKLEGENKGFKVIGTQVESKNYLGKEVKAVKVMVNVPAAVPQFREKAKELGKVLEADILFARRFLIDKKVMPLEHYRAEVEFSDGKTYDAKSLKQIGEEVPDLKILAIDIETHNPLGKTMLPEEHPVIMVALCGGGFKKVITWKKFKTDLDYIEFVNSELELLERMKDYIKQYEPDVMTGYFSDVFDFPYLKTRADKYKMKLDLGLDGSQLKINKTPANTTTSIAGIVHIDVFKFVRKVMFTSLETNSYDLNSVAKELLNAEKDDVDVDKLHIAWENNSPELEKFCSYNMQDAQLTFDLCKKLMPNVMELTRTIGLPMFDVSRMSYSQLVEWYLIKQAKEFNELVPNRPNSFEEKKRRSMSYEGAFVYEPTPGRYSDIVVFDFLSLYPTIISAHNISPDTINCDCCKKKSENKTPGEETWFCTKKKGFIPTVIDEVIKRRMRVKEIIKATGDDKTLNARQMALKTIANSMYGYFGYAGARWYNLDCAKAITAFGRNHIQDVIAKAKGKGFKVLYGDTDSILMTLDGKTREYGKEFVAEINEHLPGMMELEYEGFYSAGLFVGTRHSGQGAKKKYALLAENGNIKIRGFETVRRNLSLVAKETQEKVIDMILRDNNPKEAFEYVREVIDKVRQKKMPIEKIEITTQLKKEIDRYESKGPHVAAAQRMKDKGTHVASGSVIKYVVTEGKGQIRDRVKLPEEVKDGEYDSEYYITHQIVPPVAKIFDIFEYNTEELTADKNQKKLETFFG
jgi:DNA polymerase, archaea type